jgi:hypothetical protein
MKNEKWYIGDWVLCTNVEPMVDGTIIDYSPEGEYLTVLAEDGHEYCYPETTTKLALIKEEPATKVHLVDPSDISDIDMFFLHVMESPSTISGVMARDVAKKAMATTNIKAKHSACFFLTISPKKELNEKWRQQAVVLANGCTSLKPMMAGFLRVKTSNKPTPTKSSGILN